MPFDKVETQVDFPAQERAILEFWERTGAFDKLRQKNAGKPKWSKNILADNGAKNIHWAMSGSPLISGETGCTIARAAASARAY